jgi:hypothetical protein
VSLVLPLIIPAGFGFIGSFGGITRFKVRRDALRAHLQLSLVVGSSPGGFAYQASDRRLFSW